MVVGVARGSGATAVGIARAPVARARVRAMSPWQPGGGRGGDNRPGRVPGLKSTIAGAAIGGLLAGPLGALLGGRVGGSFGADAARQRDERARLASLGLTPADLAAAQEVVNDYKEAEESLQIVADAADAARARAAALADEAEAAYASAREALAGGDERGARAWLERREAAGARTERARADAADAEARVRQMEQAVESLARRALDVEGVIARTVVASTARRAADEAAERRAGDSALADERWAQGAPFEPSLDPWEARFRELEGK